MKAKKVLFPSLRGRRQNSVVARYEYEGKKKIVSCGYWGRSVRHMSAAPPRSAAKSFVVVVMVDVGCCHKSVVFVFACFEFQNSIVGPKIA